VFLGGHDFMDHLVLLIIDTDQGYSLVKLPVLLRCCKTHFHALFLELPYILKGFIFCVILMVKKVFKLFFHRFLASKFGSRFIFGLPLFVFTVVEKELVVDGVFQLFDKLVIFPVTGY
jgi:hypothetical protein